MNIFFKLTGAAVLAFSLAGCSDGPEDYAPETSTSGPQPQNGIEAQVINIGEVENAGYNARIIKLEGASDTHKDDIFLLDMYPGNQPAVRRGYGFASGERISREQAQSLIDQAYADANAPSLD